MFTFERFIQVNLVNIRYFHGSNIFQLIFVLILPVETMLTVIGVIEEGIESNAAS